VTVVVTFLTLRANHFAKFKMLEPTCGFCKGSLLQDIFLFLRSIGLFGIQKCSMGWDLDNGTLNINAVGSTRYAVGHV
jgi:hypothetical protein